MSAFSFPLRGAGRLAALGFAAWIGASAPAGSGDLAPDPCARPAPGAAVQEPADLRSRDGVLRVDLSIRNHREPDGTSRYCYIDGHGRQAPTLRLHPGDLLVLKLKNELQAPPVAWRGGGAKLALSGAMCKVKYTPPGDPCASGAMSPIATNLHFHGLTVPAVCHQDDVLKTSIQPTDAPFEYRFRIPQDEPPGLYWYHPHIHGYSSARRFRGGASGALIVEGLERARPEVAGLPERVLVIRDQHPAAPGRAAFQVRAGGAEDAHRA